MRARPAGQNPHNEKLRSSPFVWAREIINLYTSHKVSMTSDPNRIWAVQQNTGLVAHLHSHGELRTIMLPATMTSSRFMVLLHCDCPMREVLLSQLFDF
jgi:hypothetical protein